MCVTVGKVLVTEETGEEDEEGGEGIRKTGGL